MLIPRSFILLSTLLVSNCLLSQSPKDTVEGILPQLIKQKRVSNKYVNFDVFKLMPGFGRSTDNLSGYGTGFSFRGQVLCPYSVFKDHFPIAYGLSVGYSKITRTNAQYVFVDDKLMAIQENKTIENTMQRTGHIGLIALRVFRCNSITILTGASADFNILGSKLKTRMEDSDLSTNNRSQINTVSIPLHFQLSYSPKQFLSFGLFTSYDTKPRFRGNNFPKSRQLIIGGSAAIIL